MSTIKLTSNEFSSRISNFLHTRKWDYLDHKPCIIDFYTSWCMPCKTIASILEDLACEYKEQIHVYKINADEEPQLAEAFAVKFLPTLIFCPMNDHPHVICGSISKMNFVEYINDVLLQEFYKLTDLKPTTLDIL